jgi:hypothetical protein
MSAVGTSLRSLRCKKSGRYWSNNGQRAVLGLNGYAAIDPTAALAVHCGNGFDAGFSPYRSTRLSR